MSVSSPIRIVIADDHPIILVGLRNLIEAEADLDLVGEATTGLAALKIIADVKPDVAVLDISMPALNGIVLIRRLVSKQKDIRVLVLTSHENEAHAKQALEAGARGYILKKSVAPNLIPAIRAVFTGGLYVDPNIAERVFGDAAKVGGSTLVTGQTSLTDRERDVLKQTALGLANKEIAQQLGIGVKSVETYKARGTEKIGIKTRAELVRYAAAQGWFADV